MLLKAATPHFPDEIVSSLSSNPAPSIPALDLYNQRVFRNTIHKIEESSRKQAIQAVKREDQLPGQRRKSISVCQLTRLGSLGSKVAPSTLPAAHLNAKPKAPLIPVTPLRLQSRRKSCVTELGASLAELQRIASSNMNEVEEESAASEASSTDRSLLPSSLSSIGTQRSKIAQIPSRHISKMDSLKISSASSRRSQRKKSIVCEMKLDFPESEEEQTLSSENSQVLSSQRSQILNREKEYGDFKLQETEKDLSQKSESSKKNCIILPNSQWKIKWDIWISVLISAPYIIVEAAFDLFFLIDIWLTFFAAYYNSHDVLIEKRSQIACNYLKFWFILDLISAFPISLILQQAAEVQELARVARLTRLHKILKMVKLVHVTRLLKQHSKIRTKVNRMLNSSFNTERLLLFILVFFILCHVSACLWYLVARLEDLSEGTWVFRYGLEEQSPSGLYMVGFYFTIASITTVGYGDVSAGTFAERGFCIVLMLVGAVSYSFAISSFSSLISSIDSKQTRLKDKVNVLDSLKAEYDIDEELYWKLRQSLYYDHTTDMTEKMRFLRELPPGLRVGLSHLIYRKTVQGVEYLEQRSPHFMATVGPLLRPALLPKGEFVFLEGDPLDASKSTLNLVYFLKKGSVGFVTRRETPPDLIYATLREGSCFGDTDFLNLNQTNPRRQFSVKALTDVQILLLSKKDLLQIGVEFKSDIADLFQDSVTRLHDLQRQRLSGQAWCRALLQEPLTRTRSDKSTSSLYQQRKERTIAPQLPRKYTGSSLFAKAAKSVPKRAFTTVLEEEVENTMTISQHSDSIQGDKLDKLGIPTNSSKGYSSIISERQIVSQDHSIAESSWKPETQEENKESHKRRSALGETLNSIWEGEEQFKTVGLKGRLSLDYSPKSLSFEPEGGKASILRKTVERRIEETSSSLEQIKNTLSEMVDFYASSQQLNSGMTSFSQNERRERSLSHCQSLRPASGQSGLCRRHFGKQVNKKRCRSPDPTANRTKHFLYEE